MCLAVEEQQQNKAAGASSKQQPAAALAQAASSSSGQQLCQRPAHFQEVQNSVTCQKHVSFRIQWSIGFSFKKPNESGVQLKSFIKIRIGIHAGFWWTSSFPSPWIASFAAISINFSF